MKWQEHKRHMISIFCLEFFFDLTGAGSEEMFGWLDFWFLKLSFQCSSFINMDSISIIFEKGGGLWVLLFFVVLNSVILFCSVTNISRKPFMARAQMTHYSKYSKEIPIFKALNSKHKHKYLTKKSMEIPNCSPTGTSKHKSQKNLSGMT